MGRKVANKTISHERAVESMAHVVYGVREGKYDEMPDCYKKIDEVMAAQADLVMPLWRLVPLAVVKG
jgi:RNA-splicing ligase RtcB